MNEVVEGVLTVRRKAHKELWETDVCVLPSRSGAEPEALLVRVVRRVGTGSGFVPPAVGILGG